MDTKQIKTTEMAVMMLETEDISMAAISVYLI